MKKFYRVEIPESQSQSKNFYAIAVEETSFNITKAVAAVTFTHDARINDPKPPVPCNQGISNTGGFETFSVIVNLGSNRGNVNVNYNMYTIPDSLAISKLSGPSARIYNSWGTISGNGSVSFAYDPSLFPDNAVNVVVQGGSAGTEWYVSVSCPK